jgi:hypothetical protein
LFVVLLIPRPVSSFVRRRGAAVESLTDQQRDEIDALILAGNIIAGMSRIMKACDVRLQNAKDLFRERYRRLRTERGAEFACGDEEYWSGYSEDIFELMAKGW